MHTVTLKGPNFFFLSQRSIAPTLSALTFWPFRIVSGLRLPRPLTTLYPTIFCFGTVLWICQLLLRKYFEGSNLGIKCNANASPGVKE